MGWVEKGGKRTPICPSMQCDASEQRPSVAKEKEIQPMIHAHSRGGVFLYLWPGQAGVSFCKEGARDHDSGEVFPGLRLPTQTTHPSLPLVFILFFGLVLSCGKWQGHGRGAL